MKGRLWLIAAAVLTFICEQVYTGVADLQKESVKLQEKVDRLERDETKWGTLAELTNENQQLRQDLEIMRGVWEYELKRKISFSGDARIEDTANTAPWAPETTPLPVPIAPAPIKPVDPDSFRMQQQTKYPNEYLQQKK